MGTPYASNQNVEPTDITVAVTAIVKMALHLEKGSLKGFQTAFS
jgi:hypothetical protein